MRILIVTARPADFAAFLAELRRQGVDAVLSPTGEAALESAKITPPVLCVVDDALPDTTPFTLVAAFMRQNALMHTAVVTALSAEAFHEAGEGLGILATLPRHPGTEDAEALLKTLATVS